MTRGVTARGAGAVDGVDGATAVAEDGVDLPRPQSGAQPQHLIVTLVGDYWLGRPEHLPSAALVQLVGEFGVTGTSARAALSRLARRGVLVSSKRGRNTFYGLTAEAEHQLRLGGTRIVRFGLDEPEPGEGFWKVVVFSVPEDRRDVRHALRTRLRWQGFASRYDGVWISPRAVPDVARRILGELGVEDATVLRAKALHPPPGAPGHPLAAWDLDELRRQYEAFVAEFGPLRDRVRRGRVGAAEALVRRTAIMDQWRRFPLLDPELPPELMPPHWPRARAREIFADVYDALGPLAEFRFRQLLAELSPDLADLARHHRTMTMLEEWWPRAARGTGGPL